jgi:sodium-dependent dicarboxylate transporter 2/3/5
MLGIAYACSLGGMATLVGTPPNLSFARIFEITFPNAESIAFGQWLVMALPVTIILLTIVWLLLTRVFFRFGESFEVDRDVVKREYAALGSIPFEERAVAASLSRRVGSRQRLCLPVHRLNSDIVSQSVA